MKNIILIFFILVTNILFSQQNQYLIDVFNLNYRINAGVKNNTSSNIKIIIYYESGPPEQIYYRGIENEGDNENNKYVFSDYRSRKPINVECYAFVNFRTGSDANGSVFQDLNFNCPNGFFSGFYSPRMTNITFNYKVIPVHTLAYPTVPGPPVTNDNFLPAEDKVTLSAKSGFQALLYNYQYKFSTQPDSQYVNISTNFSVLDKLNISAIDLFGTNGWEIHSGKYLNFRVVSCFYNGDYTSKSNLVTLKVARSAPHIVGIPTRTPVSCFSDTSDGTATFTFDRLLIGCNGCRENRNLIPDETLNYTLFYGGTDISGSVLMNADKTFTISNLASGNYTIKFTGYYDGNNTYTSGINHTRNFTIEKPQLPVAFTANKTDVLCYNGNDGKITLNASGGTTQGTNTYHYSLDLGATWVPFTNGNTHTIIGLNPANYIIKVRDSKACVARIQTPVGNDIQLGDEIELPLTIQPIATPVVVTYSLVQQPTFYGGTNGKIVATVTGGTPFANNSYDFEWKNSFGVVQTNTTTSFSGGLFYITLNNVGADTYKLTVKDKNYATATQQGGCSVLDSQQILPQPDPIVVTFTALPPKCNATNQFGNETDLNPADGKRDESQNGQLIATVTGGVPYTGFQNNSKPYKYFWKKQLPDGSWQSIDNQNTTLLYVSDGNYALNVEDSNLIKLGIYTNNVLTQEVDKTILVQQPAQLELALTKQDVTCGNANTGSATANVSGGIARYTYQWNDANSSTTQTITGLGAGNYFVRVTDANGCVVQGSVNLPQPSNIVISDSSQNPTCFQSNDGGIDLIIRGGNAPFTYIWNTRARSEDLTNIPAGNYSVTITDRLGCTFQHNVVLINPDTIVVNLGSDRTLCNNQSHALDISINDPSAQYLWTSTNGFTSRSASVNLTQAGTYHAKIISSLGCVSEDDIIIQTNQVNIESEFFVTSQAYLDEEVMLVNTSNPFGENTQWVIPNGVNIIDQQQKFVVLKFNTIGTHTISLKQTQGDCYALFSKNIKVEDRSTIPNANNNNSPFIKDFLVTPNPNNGQFTTVINLQEISPVKLRLFSYSGQTAIIQKSEAGKKNYVVDFNVALPSGTYVLVLETAQQTLIRKIIIL